MPFASGLRETLQFRQSQLAAEIFSGENLEQLLSKQLLAVEAMADDGLITSVLLLSEDGKRLWHGAAPQLPKSYCEAINGSEIGPCAGSCGTAAYFGRPVYVSDIATDPLWANYRHLALPHDLRSCWSTPICGRRGEVIGTFAIYRRTVGEPTSDEIEAIELITDHVVEAILMARGVQDFQRPTAPPPHLRLVVDQSPNEATSGPNSRLLKLAAQLESKAAELDLAADDPDSAEHAATLKSTAELSRKLVQSIRAEIEKLDGTPLR